MIVMDVLGKEPAAMGSSDKTYLDIYWMFAALQ